MKTAVSTKGAGLVADQSGKGDTKAVSTIKAARETILANFARCANGSLPDRRRDTQAWPKSPVGTLSHLDANIGARRRLNK